VPTLFVVGARESSESKVAIRRLGSERQEFVARDQAITDLIAACKAPF
jgi:threonyl-tRNA synthetase